MKVKRQKGVSGILALTMIFSMLFGVMTVPDAAWAVMETLCSDDFTDAAYTVDSALPTTIWAGDRDPLTGNAAIGKVQSSSDIMSGRVLETIGASTNMSAYRSISPEIGMNATSGTVYYVRFNFQLTKPSLISTKFFGIALTSTSANAAIFGIRSSGTAFYPSVNLGTSHLENTNSSITSGTWYTVVGRLSPNGSSDNIKVKIFPYGTSEPANWDVDCTSNSSLSVSRIGVYATLGAGGADSTQRIADIHLDSYGTSTDVASADKAYEDAAKLNPDFSNITSTGPLTITPSSAFNAGTTVTWSSSDTSYIAPTADNSGLTVLRQPSQGEGNKNMFVRATITNGAAVTQKDYKVTIKEWADPDLTAVNNTISNLTWSGITSDASIAVAHNLSLATSNPTYGTTVEWSVLSGGSYVDSSGVITRPASVQGDQAASIRATASKGSAHATKDFNLSVLAQSGTTMSEDFGSLAVGQAITTMGADPGHGWASGWYTDSSASTPFDDATCVLEDNYNRKTVNLRPSGSLYRRLTAGINFDVDRDYYLKWNCFVDGTNLSTGSSSEIVEKISLYDGTDERVGIGLKTYVSDPAHQNGGKSMFPFVKSTNNGIVYDYNVNFAPGVMYTCLFKLQARATGNDTVSYKIYPVGKQEPKDYQGSVSKPITGIANGFGILPGGKTPKYGNFECQAYNAADLTPVDNAETALAAILGAGNTTDRDAAIATFNTSIANVPSGIVKESLLNRLKLISPYLDEPVLKDNTETRLYNLPADGIVKYYVNVKNVSGIVEQNWPITLAAALYDQATNKLLDIQIASQATPTINATDGSLPISITFDPAQIPSFNGYSNTRIKFFAWNGIEEMVPLSTENIVDNLGVQ